MPGSTPIVRGAQLQLRDRRSFIQLSTVLFVMYLSAGLVSPLLSVYIKSIGAGTRGIGLVTAVFQAASLLSQFWWGRWSDRLGRRKPLVQVGTAGLAVVYLGIVALQHWQWMFALRIVEGVALAAYSTGSLALIGDLLEDQRGRGKLMGLYRTCGSGAFALAALSGGWLADTFGIRLPLLLAAVCYGVACLISWRIREHSSPPRVPLNAVAEPGEDEPGEVDRDRQRALWPFGGLIFVWAFAMGSAVLLWPVYMQSIGYSKTAVGGLWGLAALGEVPCFVLAGYLADRWGRKRVLLTGLVCMAAVYSGYILSSAFAWLIAVQLLRSFAYACFEAPALLYATELGLRRQRGRLVSFYYAASGAGGITGAVLGGSVAQAVGLRTMYQGVIGLMLVVAVVAGRRLPGLRAITREHNALVKQD